MTKLSDTQAIILSAAAQRGNRIALPLPEALVHEYTSGCFCCD